MLGMKALMNIDLNSDMGEAFGAYRMGDDEALLDVVTSANIACGFHGGDPEVMANAFAMAKVKGVGVGAHPGYNDLWGFGRRMIPHSLGELERLVVYQVGAAVGLSTYAGHPITYVKLHGALGHLAIGDQDAARAITLAVKAVDPKLAFLMPAIGHHARVARELGIVVKSEIYADRGYTEEGNLTPRNLPNAIIHDPEEAASRIVRMVRAGAIETMSGNHIPVAIDSVCLHSDTPEAVLIASRVRQRLVEEGFTPAPFS